MDHLPCFINPVDLDIEIKQIEHPSRHINVFRKNAGAIEESPQTSFLPFLDMKKVFHQSSTHHINPSDEPQLQPLSDFSVEKDMHMMSDILEPPDRYAEAFVATYSHPSYANPWQAIVDYRRVQEYQIEHPNAGRTAVGNALELPPSRVRGWLNDGMPDVARGYKTARDRGWVPFRAETTTGRGLNILCAWIYAGGSIDQERYVPLFTANSDTELLLTRAADAAGIKLVESRSDESGRADEYRPAKHAPVLGRFLTALGAPAGSKNADTTVVLPRYLSEASETVRREFVSVYLNHRAAEHAEKATLTVRTVRSKRYLRTLRSLFEDVLGAECSLGGHTITIPAEGARTYQGWNAPLEDL